jgi:hypothetical protein
MRRESKPSRPNGLSAGTWAACPPAKPLHQMFRWHQGRRRQPRRRGRTVRLDRPHPAPIFPSSSSRLQPHGVGASGCFGFGPRSPRTPRMQPHRDPSGRAGNQRGCGLEPLVDQIAVAVDVRPMHGCATRPVSQNPVSYSCHGTRIRPLISAATLSAAGISGVGAPPTSLTVSPEDSWRWRDSNPRPPEFQ